MILFFKGVNNTLYAVDAKENIGEENLSKLSWLFGEAEQIKQDTVEGVFVGPRKEMLTPWSTNAVEITQNMGILGVVRIEEFELVDEDAKFDPMLQAKYEGLNQEVFTIDKKPEPVIYIEDIAAYNAQEGLALSDEEIAYLEGVSEKVGRKLTDSEVFGFSQVNSEHCRHKIFNGQFIIDGEEKESSLFQLIKKTSKENHNHIVSAYKDNVAFVDGPRAEQFAPKTQDKADFFETKDVDTVLSLKAETHNFPTTVEPFNGAATGSGGEIRDRMAGGKASIPLAGTAVYMTSYSRLERERAWEQATEERPWLYQTPMDILIKASNGASDFGNKFGQPLITGSVLTFEHFEGDKKYGYDKVIMQAGGIGFAKKQDSLKDTPETGDKIVIMGGDNYRIGMGGGAVSSVATGEFDNSIELNAIQRSNPEMQKRVCNAVRAMAESDHNPIVSIHDHGAGGHLNCLSELVEDTGGKIELDKLPVGDPTLSGKEIAGNESQERMGLVMRESDLETIQKVAERERAPFYVVGEATGDHQFTFESEKTGEKPIDLQLEDMFGKPPKTIMKDSSVKASFGELQYEKSKLAEYLTQVLQLESVACKDWLTNKVDRSVTGRVAKQQTCGPIQLPLNNLGAMAIDFKGEKAIGTSIGHSPVSALIDPKAGSRNSIAEALTNLVWAPLSHRLSGVSLSANWMWPCKNEGEDARLYDAVEAISDFACELGINVPTGKDSLSMTQKYKDDVVYSPGTVIISSVAEVEDLKKIVSPVVRNIEGSAIYYIDLSKDAYKLGGSTFAQVVNKVGNEAPTIQDTAYFKNTFNAVQDLISQGDVISGHDISAGGLITALSEMTFPQQNVGLDIDLTAIAEDDLIKLLFAENSGLIVQVADEKKAETFFAERGVDAKMIGIPVEDSFIKIRKGDEVYEFGIDSLRDAWYRTSYLLDKKQTREDLATERYENYTKQPLVYNFAEKFTGQLSQYGIDADRKEKSGVKAAIIREKGVNGDREMAYSLHLAGFDVKDVHMTDLISGRENLEDVNMIVFVGGFSNSDVLGSAKGWAGAFLYNPKAKAALDNFYKREDTLSLGVCNGCQLMQELGLIAKDHEQKPKMLHNESGKFESGFVNMTIPQNDSVMLSTLSGQRLGVWVAHGEGKFSLPYAEDQYNISGKYGYEAYPANPNGSDYNVASIHSADGRHLAMMPHLERSIFPWNWAEYPQDRLNDEVSPWIEAFVNAKNWVAEKTK
ncbi:phosphoribosylformylglycinamidine synthase [Aureibacter tunicatorum]|uniref:Phosphoribosylformylglycinamidine synthase n=1 Tax=Aureibacter tunicatorum TaxID=866807 RepID=A0AAE3XMC3_9BACT|nr:phosphoribosylformylglycinamidine synthase [Aureibacter tunicatorum]MDR6239135.1 phosphoribosylformylglycinamidine synthase [Aureibacter tunicatorum]BDD04939.1 phosphoribosylformylglycinamidine synthase [Aureibacter tunicatorum]